MACLYLPSFFNQSVEKNVGALYSHSIITNDSNVYVVMSGNFTPAQRQIVKSRCMKFFLAFTS